MVVYIVFLKLANSRRGPRVRRHIHVKICQIQAALADGF